MATADDIMREIRRTNTLLERLINLLADRLPTDAVDLADAPTFPPDAEWRITQKGNGFSAVWGGMVDDEGNDVRLVVNRGLHNVWGANAFGKDALLSRWHNGATADAAVRLLLTTLEKGNPPPSTG